MRLLIGVFFMIGFISCKPKEFHKIIKGEYVVVEKEIYSGDAKKVTIEVKSKKFTSKKFKITNSKFNDLNFILNDDNTFISIEDKDGQTIVRGSFVNDSVYFYGQRGLGSGYEYRGFRK